MKKTIGGDRLGAGNKMQVELHGYERSTHDLSYLWRSTMSAGTLVPFIDEIALPGDTFDIDLNCDIKTHPTVGPLFGSYKVQLDVFQAPIRLYNAQLHNNSLGIGLNMQQVFLPKLTFQVRNNPDTPSDIDNSQVNPSCILSYLGIRGIGVKTGTDPYVERSFNGTSLLAYLETYKNYYANKQEEVGAVLHTPAGAADTSITTVEIYNGAGTAVGALPFKGSAGTPIVVGDLSGGAWKISLEYTTTPEYVVFNTVEHGQLTMLQAIYDGTLTDGGTAMWGIFNTDRYGLTTFTSWQYVTSTDSQVGKPSVVTFPLSNIDDMRKAILSEWNVSAAFPIFAQNITPYKWLGEDSNGIPNRLANQEGLLLKTYQSDLFNNWIQTEWIDGTNGITAITAIDTSGGSFTIDTLNLSKKVYDMLNRIAISRGTYDDWLDAVYAHDRYTRAESPMYMGGLIKELVFQEVISNSQSEAQPLGTLAGRGVLSHKHKGGKIVIKVDEPSIILGIVSLTPRLDYSQGNKWHTGLITLDDLHKPALDEIGFQELITEQMAWWTTVWDDTNNKWIQKSAGKQPAWINYMTNVNQTRGNFAIKDNEMFMTLNRRYQYEEGTGITDLTTYIDPSKFNYLFAETSLDSQNFWTQIAVNMIVRRKMSAKVMPNL